MPHGYTPARTRPPSTMSEVVCVPQISHAHVFLATQWIHLGIHLARVRACVPGHPAHDGSPRV